MRPVFCEDASPVFYNLFDFSIAPPLLYYAYIPILILVIVFSTLALRYNRHNENSWLLAGMALSLGFWVAVTFLQWIAAPITTVMFSWQLWGLAGVLTYIFTTLFVFHFIYDKPAPAWFQIGMFILFLPLIIFLPTDLNIFAFDLSWCEGVNGTGLLVYTYAYQALLVLAIATFGIYAYIKPVQSPLLKRSILISTLSAVVFLSLFLAVNVWGDIIDDYRVELIGPIGAVIFLAGVSYVSLRHKHFEIKILGTELLIVGLAAVVGSMIFIQSIVYVHYIATGSLVMVIALGWVLAKSIRKEIRQREEIETLAKRLKTANNRLKELDKLKSEFVSIASHQLRSPLTSIRGYASMLLEGSFGKLNDKSKEAVERISESSRSMALSVEDYLNVSRIESGNMKYELADFNIKKEAEHIADDIRPQAIKKGLLLTYKSSIDSGGIVNADIGKVRQILHNLINNSLKYTPEGQIKVFVHDDKKKKKIYVDITDTGVGMSEESLDTVFDKFIRAKNANHVNVTGTGLGLYLARKMANDMKGDIVATSEGEGEGSTFTLVLPLQL